MMKLARTVIDGQPQFVVGRDGESWLALGERGLELPDTASVISHWDEIVELADTQGFDLHVDSRGLLSPVVRPSKVLGIGLNYLDHIRETGVEKPERPVVFAKYPNSVNDPYGDVVVDDRLTAQADYEVELAVIIGTAGRWVDESSALDSIFGFAVANDVSARDLQRSDAQFSRSKSMDTFCPIGPWITVDEVTDPQDLPLRSWVNDEPRQDSTTGEMLFSAANLIEFLSRTMTLEPGDVILTGTPHGVGFAMDPPRFLQPGDVVRCEVEGLGSIENRIVGPEIRS